MSTLLEKEWNCAVASGALVEWILEWSTTDGWLLRALWVEI